MSDTVEMTNKERKKFLLDKLAGMTWEKIDGRTSLEDLEKRYERELEKDAKLKARAEEEKKEKEERAAKRELLKIKRGADFENYQSVPVPDDKSERILHSLSYQHESLKKRHKEETEKFSKKFAEDPVYAMEWSDNLFALAAKLDVSNLVCGYFDCGMTLEEIRDVCLDRFMTMSRYTKNSTSNGSNVMHRELIAAYSEMIANLKGRIF